MNKTEIKNQQQSTTISNNHHHGGDKHDGNKQAQRRQQWIASTHAGNNKGWRQPIVGDNFYGESNHNERRRPTPRQ
jgi:hypothetical protein